VQARQGDKQITAVDVPPPSDGPHRLAPDPHPPHRRAVLTRPSGMKSPQTSPYMSPWETCLTSEGVGRSAELLIMLACWCLSTWGDRCGRAARIDPT
jgi:hypothetical protein